VQQRKLEDVTERVDVVSVSAAGAEHLHEHRRITHADRG
jgi:hypothetical protein